jgi:hypothetical protein
MTLFELRLPLAPYRFIWAGDPAVECKTARTELYSEERYTHADGTFVMLRNYHADGSFHIVSDRGEIEFSDNPGDLRAPNPIGVVTLP